MKINKDRWNEIKIREYIRDSLTYTEVLKKVGGVSVSSCGNFRTLKRYIKKYNIDINHFRRPAPPASFFKKNISEILVEHSLIGSYRLKNRLLKEGFLKNECSLCHQVPFWKDKKLNMILDHINGVYDDSRLENLRLVCPNCNSQLETNCGKNVLDKNNYKCSRCGKPLDKKRVTGLCFTCYQKQLYSTPKITHRKNNRCSSCGKKIGASKSGKCFLCVDRKHIKNRPSKEELLSMVLKIPMTKIGEKYGISSNAVKKWCQGYGIVIGNRRGYWSKIKS